MLQHSLMSKVILITIFSLRLMLKLPQERIFKIMLAFLLLQDINRVWPVFLVKPKFRNFGLTKNTIFEDIAPKIAHHL